MKAGPIMVELHPRLIVPLLVASVRVNGVGPLAFVVDTGTGRTVVSDDLAGRTGIEPGPDEELMSAHGPVRVRVGTANSIELGDFESHGSEVTIADLAPLRGAGLEVDGLIGADLLRNHTVTLDVSAPTMGLTAGSQLGPSEGIAMELAPMKPLVLVPVWVNGTGPFQFGLDTGAVASIISVELADSLQLTERSKTEALGAGGAFQVETGAATVRAGDVERHSMPVAISPMSELSAAVGARLDGLLGLDFLSTATLTLDYPGSRVSFRQCNG